MFAKKFNMSPEIVQKIKMLNISNLWKFWISKRPDWNEKMAEVMKKNGIALDSFEQQHKYFSERIIPQIIDKKYREFVFDFDITNITLE